jgi:hypothetical protein
MQSALQRFRRGEKGIKFMEVEYFEDNPDHENYPFNHGSVHGKRDYA